MFTGIVEGLGRVINLDPDKGNLHITLECPFADELKVDQSLSHNGVCLTVTGIIENCYQVTAVAETLRKSNLGLIQLNQLVNLERSMQMNGRIDGHIVQGHVDTTAVCTSIKDEQGSWMCRFDYDSDAQLFTVEKGSVCVNGVSLTVVNSADNSFSVAVIPYTYENTNFKDLKKGDVVNLEFDIIGKYVARIMGSRRD
jgi:riboflavin synthase